MPTRNLSWQSHRPYTLRVSSVKLITVVLQIDSIVMLFQRLFHYE